MQYIDKHESCRFEVWVEFRLKLGNLTSDWTKLPNNYAFYVFVSMMINVCKKHGNDSFVEA